jgi:hypothetical protein
MAGWRYILLVAPLLLTACATTRQGVSIVAEKRPMRVLFIGNSLTFTNHLPEMLQQMAAHEERPLVCQAVAYPYVSLRFHWYMGRARATIRDGRWDYVVLQDFSTQPVNNPAATIKYMTLFIDAVRQAGATPIIFENWTHRFHADDYAAMQRTYRDIAAKTHVAIAPIGTAWHAARLAQPDIHLYVDDRHPSPAGTYLAACVLYRSLYQKVPTDALPNLLKISESDALALQQIAREAKE